MAEGTLGPDLSIWAIGVVGLLLGVAATTIRPHRTGSV
jgi:hypothetical protein